MDDPDEQLRLAGECIKGSWSVRHLEAVVKGERPPGSPRTPSGRNSSSGRSRSRGSEIGSAAALEVEDQLSDLFNTSVEVVDKGGRGQLIIDFADHDDLSRIVAIVTGGSE